MKTQIFYFCTAVLSILCFNFNKIVCWMLYAISRYIPDRYIYPIGPYYRKTISINYTSIDDVEYTNRFRLLLCWRAVNNTDDFKLLTPNPKYINIQYNDSYMSIDMVENSVIKNNRTVYILFGEYGEI